jgi:hypothetical protein
MDTTTDSTTTTTYQEGGLSQLKKAGSWSDDSKKPMVPPKDRETASARQSPKLLRRGRPTDAPPIQQELIDRVRSEPFIKKFGLPPTETLIKDYSAALYKQIPLHGRLYVSQNYICFESKIFNIKTTEVIAFKDITHIRKKSKKMKFSVGIHIDVGAQTYHFASFVARDKTFFLLHDVWRQSVPTAPEVSDEDEDAEEDEDSTTVEAQSGAKATRMQRSYTESISTKYSRSLPASPKYMGCKDPLDNPPATAALTAISPFGLETEVLPCPLDPEATHCDDLLKDVVMSATPPEASTMESIATKITPSPLAETFYDDEHLSPNEFDDSEDGFLESEVFHDILTESFDVSPLNFFRVFFSDRSCFARSYHEKRGDKDMSIQKWTNSPQFGMIRDIQYYAPVKVPLGPDKTRVQETQRYVLTRTRLLIETVTIMFDIPYGDSFRLEAKWLVTAPSATASTCKLHVSMCVHFTKKTWFKGKIESTSMKEMKESFNQWAILAREEIAKPEVRQRLTSPVPSASSLPTVSAPTASVQQETVAASPATTSAVETTESSTSSSSSCSAAATVSVDAQGNAQVQTEQLQAKQGTLEIKFVSKDEAKPQPVRHTKRPPIPSATTSSNGITSLLEQLDKQTVLILLVVFLSFVCMYLYFKLAHLEGKFSVVENLLHKQLGLNGGKLD